MKTMFKPLGLAVAAASIAYAGVSNAQIVERSIGNLGDAAIVPYYTVQDDWVTGVHIINSSERTQVVKLRLRRGSDSADALDFNLILSPEDEWTGFLTNDNGVVTFNTEDTSCTAPIRANGKFPMTPIYNVGAEEGYIEVIGMGSPVGLEGPSAQPPLATNATSAIGYWAKHVDGVPRNCEAVASNFFADGEIGVKNGVVNFATTVGKHVPTSTTDTQQFDTDTYTGSPNSLKVSYFVRDAESGIEFGGDAVHLSDFSAIDEPFMTNQETGLFSGDVEGFDYPDLDGGPVVVAAANPFFLRYKFPQLRRGDVLGVQGMLNDWSIASARNVSTDWVVTMPGQYAMLDTYVWLNTGLGVGCGQPAIQSTGQTPIPLCDFRDIPVTADLTLFDREEGKIVPDGGDLVISPQPPGQSNTLVFPNEVNVVEWTDGQNVPVLGSQYAVSVDASILGESGWASLSVSSANRATSGGQRVCELDVFSNVVSRDPVVFDTNGVRPTCLPVDGQVPMVGFVAWERSFPQNPEGNYGRLIDHSFVQASVVINP